MKKLNRRSLKIIAKAMIIVMLVIGIVPIIPAFEKHYTSNAASEEVSVFEAVYKAIDYHYEQYTSGHPVDAGWGNFGAYEAYILTESGEIVSEWVYGDSNLKEDVIKLIDDTIRDPNEKTIDWSGNEVYAKTSKRVAQEYLAAKSWGETNRAQSLLDILKSRQEANEDGSLDGNAFSDIPAYELLGRAGDINEIDISKAIDYILGNQDSTTGAWTSSWNDFMTTAEAIRALVYLKDYAGEKSDEVQTAIDKGLEWLRSKQQADGSFANGDFDDPAIDTAEVILTLSLLEIDPNTWRNNEGKSPVDYLRNGALNSDGTFGTSKNLMDATWVLDAYTKLDLTKVEENEESNDEEEIIQPIYSTIKVYVAIIGEDGEVIYEPKKVTLSEDDEYGLTALGSLDATGVDYSISEDWDGFVEEVEGIKNKGMNGWMYAVNGKVPSVLAADKKVSSSDKILWWYSDDPMGEPPEWPDEDSMFGNTTSLTVDDSTKEEMKKTLDKYRDELFKIEDKTNILNSDNKMTERDAEKLEKELKSNEVKISEEVDKEEVLLTDNKKEVSLLVPEKALSNKKTITVEDLKENENPKQFAIKTSSSTYEFKPNGTKFDKPVTISIKFPIKADMDLNRLTPAWYDEENKKWIPIPGLIDAKEGMAIFKIDHFTKFAVIEMPKRVVFEDVDENISWAKDAIEILAGQDIIKGTGGGYEPQRAITRAEFVNLIVKALDLSTKEDSDIIFSDVKNTDWFSDTVKIAYENNLILGDKDGRFRPNNKITRNEIATILYRLNKSQNIDIKDYELDIRDKSEIPDWALNGVKYVYNQGLMIGYEDKTFKGNKSFSRAEAAVVIYRYLNEYNN